MLSVAEHPGLFSTARAPRERSVSLGHMSNARHEKTVPWGTRNDAHFWTAKVKPLLPLLLNVTQHPSGVSSSSDPKAFPSLSTLLLMRRHHFLVANDTMGHCSTSVLPRQNKPGWFQLPECLAGEGREVPAPAPRAPMGAVRLCPCGSVPAT